MSRAKDVVSLVVRRAENGYTVHKGEDYGRGTPGTVYVAETDEALDQLVLDFISEVK